MKRITKLLLPFLLLGLVTSCTETEFKEGVVVAGGEYIEAHTLNKGKQIYREYCMACHGAEGDGKGVASKGMRTPPRNFKLGLIKFGDVSSGELSHDQAIFKTLKEGLAGTAMLPWDLTPGQMKAVWSYIKTFSPETWIGKDKNLGEQITLTKDPFGLARKSAAIERGREVYHVTANCQSCHRAYVTKNELSAMTKKLTGDSMSSDDFDDDMYKIKLQESDHGYMTIPPDQTWDAIRSASSVNDLYLRIAAGVGGTSMPAWKGTIENDEIWAVSYYVRYLMDMKDSPERAELMKKLENQ